MKGKYISISIFIISVIVFAVYLKSATPSHPTKAKVTQIDVHHKLGKRIYERNCIGCHDAKMMAYKTAPPLGGITKRREKKWLYGHTRNSVRMFEEGDSLSVKLRSENSGLMPDFPHLDDKKLDAVYYYIEKEYEKNKPE